MSTYYLIPEEVGFRERLIDRINNCTYATIASAFFTYDAFKEFESSLKDALEKGAKINFLLGVYGFVTEPKAVNELLKLSEKFPQLHIYFDYEYSFHYKVAVFKLRSNNKKVTIIGSSNLTQKGLVSIGEINLEIVENSSVFTQSKRLLERRINLSKNARDEIHKYTLQYNQTKRYRLQRMRWDQKGQRIWGQKRHRFIQRKELQENNYVLCWIGDEEKDKTLKKNIASKYKETKKETGFSFPNQWVHISNRFGARFKENEHFVVFDDLSSTFGFALCTRKFKVLDSHDRQTTVVFYRFKKGWKSQQSEKLKYKNASRLFGINIEKAETIKNKPLNSLITYLKSRQKKNMTGLK